MNSENAPKEIVQSFIDLVSMGKGLMNENQQSSVTQELGRFFPSIISWGRRGESSELLRVNAGESSAAATNTNNINFTIRSTTKRMIEEIWGSKATSKKPRKSMSHKTTSGKTPRKFAILFHVKHEFKLGTWFMLFLKFDLPRLYFEVLPYKKWVLLSHFSLVQKEYKGRLWTRAFEANMSNKPCAKWCFRNRSGHYPTYFVSC